MKKQMPITAEIDVKNGKAYINLFGCPGPMKLKALKENGFKRKQGVFVGRITESNRFFIRLLTGKDIVLEVEK